VGTQVFRAPAPTLADARHLRDLLQRRLKERGSINSMDVMLCAAQIAAAGVLRPPGSTK